MLILCGRIGIDYKKLIIPEKTPNSIEEVFQLIENVAKLARINVPQKDRPVLIVWDSVAATSAEGEKEVDYDASSGMATEARSLSRSFRKAMPMLDQGFITLVCINQLRSKIGVMFGDPDITPGGRALPFYSSVRIKLRASSQIKDPKTERTLGVIRKRQGI
jgi:recombination protein RecA